MKTSIHENFMLEHPVRWGDMDAFSHVNNTIYFRYFEEARVCFFQESGVKSNMDEHNLGFVLSETSCKFIFPITYPDTVLINFHVTNILDDRFSVQQTMTSQQYQKIAAKSTATIVAYDHNQKQKAMLPDAVTAILQNNFSQ